MSDVNNPASPIDQAWQTRIPQGWIQFPDGSIGPPNQVGSDWNAPFRQPPTGGMGFPSQGQLPVNQPGTPPGIGGTTGYRGPPLTGSPSAPGLGYSGGTSLNTTGPEIFPPNRGINPTRQVGPFTGGTSTDASWSDWADPRNWFKGGQQFNAGQPITRGQMNPFGFIGRGNPYWRGALAAGGMLQPTPLQQATGVEAPRTLGRSPSGPNNLFPPTPSGIGSDANFPVMGAGGFPTTYAPPGQQPAMPSGPPAAATPPATARGPARGRINPASVNIGYGTPGIPGNATAQASGGPGPWGMIDRPNASASGYNPGAPKMTALDLSGLFNRSAPAAATAQANPANVPAANAQNVNAAAPASTRSRVNPNWGPLQKGSVWPSQMGPFGWTPANSGFGG